jgi:cell division-specific peptidoglycan biosynthesis regulator FtsW
MDPWERQFDSGYQLVQSLIAFGRGEWLGTGLGNSMQKLFFLPEAHTDFIFSIYSEEFGLIGALVLIGLFSYFVWKMLCLSRVAFYRQKLFGCYLVFGIAVMVAVQAFINMGVASGLLPTKGLTLPFVSYGGSSLLVTCTLVALVFRVAWEERFGAE